MLLVLFPILCIGNFLAVLGPCNLTSKECALVYESRRPLSIGSQSQEPNGGFPKRLKLDTRRSYTLSDGLESSEVSFEFLDATKIAFVSCNRLADSTNPSIGMYAQLQSEPMMRLVVHLGDQVYFDRVYRQFGSSNRSDEMDVAVRAAYHASWVPIRQALLLAENVMIPDDHDFLNNINNTARHGQGYMSSTMEYLHAYQNTELDDMSSFRRLNRVALCILDIRFWRIKNNSARLYSPQTFNRLKDFIREVENDETIQTIVIATQYPLLYINRFLAKVVEFSDGELYPMNGFSENVETLFRFLEMETKKRIVLVGGDHHHFAKSVIKSSSGSSREFESYVSSGMTVESTAASGNVGTLLFLMTKWFPATCGHFYATTPSELFFGQNYLVLDTVTGELVPRFGKIEGLAPQFRQLLTRIDGLTLSAGLLIVSISMVQMSVLIFRRS